MWYECLYKAEFLHKLYNEIPPLNDVRIESITIWEEGHRIKIMFDMPNYPDSPPAKWEGYYNTAVVEAEFSNISKLQISTTSNAYRGDISIDKNSEGLFEVSIEGNITLNFIADFGFIQRITAYQKSEERIF